jgi:hypothetical protein
VARFVRATALHGGRRSGRPLFPSKVESVVTVVCSVSARLTVFLTCGGGQGRGDATPSIDRTSERGEPFC